ncbi:MAG: protease inhibitor I42 family protein [Synechococcaceae cyanobacterium]|nr:protease inhibitor I42 family protein [Synechococcaceae cyanobacterium]
MIHASEMFTVVMASALPRIGPRALLLGLLLAWSAPLPAAAASPADTPADTLTVSEADSGRTLNLRRGEQLRVVLSDSAGTGYSWEIERLGAQLKLLQRQSRQDPGPPGSPGLVGGPLQVTFLFRAEAAGETRLELRHWRPWEGPRSIDRRFRLGLRIGG